MSWEALSRVWQQEITPPARKLVAVALADAATDECICWPSHRHLAARCCISPESVRQHVRALEEERVIERETRARENGSQTSNSYVILAPVADHPPVAAHQGGGGSSPGGGGGSSPPQTHKEEPPENHLQGPEGQLFEHDPVKEVFEHYCNTVPGKANSRLSQSTRKLIKRALDERPIDQLKLAINGLATSQHHIEGGWTGIQYAIGKIRASETPGDRIDTMAAKAPKQSASGEITVEDSLRTVPSDRHWIIRETMSLVIQAIKRGERAEREEEMLRRSPGVEPVIDTSRGEAEFKGWRKVS